MLAFSNASFCLYKENLEENYLVVFQWMGLQKQTVYARPPLFCQGRLAEYNKIVKVMEKIITTPRLEGVLQFLLSKHRK